MKEWTLDQIILAPGAAEVDLDLRAREIEVLRKENADLRAGINEAITGGSQQEMRIMLKSLLDKGGA